MEDPATRKALDKDVPMFVREYLICHKHFKNGVWKPDYYRCVCVCVCVCLCLSVWYHVEDKHEREEAAAMGICICVCVLLNFFTPTRAHLLRSACHLLD
jgi:hypothetical protein